jgi:membrane-associated protease RseP (regulator of RpoE activity)
MRLWPFRARPPVALAPAEELVSLDELLRRATEDLLAVRERRLGGLTVVFGGELLVPPGRALALLEARLEPYGYTPFLREEGGQVWVQALPLAQVSEPSRPLVNLLLFLATVVSTVWAGSGVLNPLADPARLWAGLQFSVALLSILVTHELGHYFTARRYRASVSLPYFIPAPPPFIFGTLGALIKMRSPARDRNSLFDIAVAGPLAGLLVAVPVLLTGLGWSRPVRLPPDLGGIVFGDSLLMRFLQYLTFGHLPEGVDILIHPVGLAGWVGLFVTALNLFPVGQLDGGRIAYALFGVHHRRVSMATFLGLLALGAVTGSMNWIVWAALLFFLIGFHHSPPMDDVTPLSAGRRLVGAGCLLLLVLLIPPVPLTIR